MDEKLTLNIKLKSKDDLDNVVQHFVTTTQESLLLASKKTNINNKKYSYMEPPIFIKRLIAEKRRTRHIWYQKNYPNDKHTLNNLTNRLKKELSKYRSLQFQKSMTSLNPNGSLRKTTKNIIQRKEIIPPIHYLDNSLAISDKEKAVFLVTTLKIFSSLIPILIQILNN